MSTTQPPQADTTPNVPSHHLNAFGTAFKNPWPSAEKPTVTELLENKFPLGWYESYAKKHPGTQDVKVVAPDWGASNLKKNGLDRAKCVIGTSLGHAGVITELPLEGTANGADGVKESFWIVYDPIFSERAGPTPFTGPKRMRPPPCQVTDLPGCDVVMISHNHYDHLDTSTIEALFKKFPNAKYFVPLGNKKWLHDLGVSEEKIFELDWWQKRELSMSDLGFTTSQAASEDALLRFTCVPAQHNSGRDPLDLDKTLWCGWIIEQMLVSNTKTSPTRRKGAIYHAGDTGYRRTAKSTAVCPIFKQIGEDYGPFDLSFVPIWRGGTLEFISHLGFRLNHNDIPSALHAAPADALDIHKDVRSRNSVAIHFGTFVGSVNESMESVMEFEDGRESRGVARLESGADTGEGRAGIIDIGASLAVEIETTDVGGHK
ncbi:Metallo-hydrolase/oxidoreductase [Mollisia scopiformis]|uniref:Metallo-hydrolase/oxidoreductase n=1 Tax=Mollisia scopiformis TaxID=149040 RepID=A0A132B363_MOLSC|nr:Metallo-hydrolase/oxidoreductase [Mollisia scopiformis]KUJ06836.1 Metallo-hydrolase/oxidoreductase [Mollisia scopiformis]